MLCPSEISAKCQIPQATGSNLHIRRRRMDHNTRTFKYRSDTRYGCGKCRHAVLYRASLLRAELAVRVGQLRWSGIQFSYRDSYYIERIRCRGRNYSIWHWSRLWQIWHTLYAIKNRIRSILPTRKWYSLAVRTRAAWQPGWHNSIRNSSWPVGHPVHRCLPKPISTVSAAGFTVVANVSEVMPKTNRIYAAGERVHRAELRSQLHSARGTGYAAFGRSIQYERNAWLARRTQCLQGIRCEWLLGSHNFL